MSWFRQVGRFAILTTVVGTLVVVTLAILLVPLVVIALVILRAPLLRLSDAITRVALHRVFVFRNVGLPHDYSVMSPLVAGFVLRDVVFAVDVVRLVVSVQKKAPTIAAAPSTTRAVVDWAW